MKKYDVILVGGGHNGLVAACVLAKSNKKVLILEAKDTLGGACITEHPFSKVPDMPASSGAYLLGLMPPEIMEELDINIPVIRRDPHYFLPNKENGYLLFGSDQEALEKQFKEFFSLEDWEANCKLQKELEALREDLASTWLMQPESIEETAEKYVRNYLQDRFVNLCRGSVGDYIDSFGFKSDLVKAMYAVTDGFTGLYGTWDTPGSGMNFLIHNMCRLPGSDGTWMVVKGGMGTATTILAEKAESLGCEILCNSKVEKIITSGNIAQGVSLENGNEYFAETVLINADPYSMQELIGKDNLSEEYNSYLDKTKRPGSTMKVNMVLKDLPKFTCLPENKGQHNATMHIMPQDGNIIENLISSFEEVKNGRLAMNPTIEWYNHTTVDPSLSDPDGNYNSALFVQWVPYELKDSTWEQEEEMYVKHLLSLCDQYAPGTSELVIDTFPLTPKKVESHFGIKYGHIHHLDNTYGFSDRLPYSTPIDGLYSCSAGCHPGGSVIGAAGYNAANLILSEL